MRLHVSRVASKVHFSLFCKERSAVAKSAKVDSNHATAETSVSNREYCQAIQNCFLAKKCSFFRFAKIGVCLPFEKRIRVRYSKREHFGFLLTVLLICDTGSNVLPGYKLDYYSESSRGLLLLKPLKMHSIQGQHEFA